MQRVTAFEKTTAIILPPRFHNVLMIFAASFSVAHVQDAIGRVPMPVKLTAARTYD